MWLHTSVFFTKNILSNSSWLKAREELHNAVIVDLMGD